MRANKHLGRNHDPIYRISLAPGDGVASIFRQTKFAVAAAPRRAARGLVAAYRYTLSPLVGFHCRHLPTCSAYADQALDRFGLWAGGWMTLARLCRCHPFGTSGLDVVADSLPADARWYAPWRYARWRGTNPGPPLRGAGPGADGSTPH